MTVHSSYYYDYDRNDLSRPNPFTEEPTMENTEISSVISESESNLYPLAVCEHEDGTFSIEWDENDPVTSMFNDWSQEDFIEMIRRGVEDEIGLKIMTEWDQAQA